MSVITRIASAVTRRFSGLWGGFSGSGSTGFVGFNTLALTEAGITVTPLTALGLTSVFSAVATIATDTAGLPLGVYKRRPDGGRDEARDHPAYDLLNVTPDGETTAMRWRQALMGHVLTYGNGYAEIEPDFGGRPYALHLLDPNTRSMRRGSTEGAGLGALYYQLPNNKQLAPYQVIHVAGLGFNGLDGYSPVVKACQAIGLAIAAETFGATFFGRGAMPGGILTSPNNLDSTAKRSLRKAWKKIHGGPDRSHETAVLTGGLTWQKISTDPDEAQFIELRKFQILEIARVFRLPPSKIADLDNAHLANLEESNLDYLMTTLLPWCEQIEQAMNLRLFTRAERKAGYFVEHNINAFLRGNMQGRAEFYGKLFAMGVLTPNMIARLENLNPIGPEGDVRLVPLNMTTLANAGKPAATEPSPAAKRALEQIIERLSAAA